MFSKKALKFEIFAPICIFLNSWFKCVQCKIKKLICRENLNAPSLLVLHTKMHMYDNEYILNFQLNSLPKPFQSLVTHKNISGRSV